MSKRQSIKQEWLPYVYEIFTTRDDLTSVQKAELLNKKYETDFDESAFRKKAQAYGIGLQNGLSSEATDKELERIAKKELNIMVQQKKTTLMKGELHKQTRKLALADIVRETLAVDFDYPKTVIRKPKQKTKPKRIIDLVIADIQFKGGKKEVDWVNHIMSVAREEILKIDITETDKVRMKFLGDDIEGDNAHESTLNEITKLKIGQTRELAPLLVGGINEFFKDLNTKDKALSFVPYSNHGLAFGKGKARYQFLEEDLGLVLFDFIKLGVNKDIFIYEPNEHLYVVETEDSIDYHGHLGYNKNKKRNDEVLGNKKDLDQAHLHHFEVREERNRTVSLFPTCRRDFVRYERAAGYNPVPQITLRIKEDNGNRTIKTIKL